MVCFRKVALFFKLCSRLAKLSGFCTASILPFDLHLHSAHARWHLDVRAGSAEREVQGEAGWYIRWIFGPPVFLGAGPTRYLLPGGFFFLLLPSAFALKSLYLILLATFSLVCVYWCGLLAVGLLRLIIVHEFSFGFWAVVVLLTPLYSN